MVPGITSQANSRKRPRKKNSKRFLKDSSLAEYESASWSSRSVTTNTGELEGTVTTAQGPIPIKITFVKDADGWKIQYIEREPTGIANEVDVTIPTLEESAELVKTTTSDFAAAVNNKDFTEFHATIAKEFPRGVITRAIRRSVCRVYRSGNRSLGAGRPGTRVHNRSRANCRRDIAAGGVFPQHALANPLLLHVRQNAPTAGSCWGST